MASDRWRRMTFEQLDARELMAVDVTPVETITPADVTEAATVLVYTGMHNHAKPMDVNNDGQVTMSDLATLLNDIHHNGLRELEPRTTPLEFFPDVDRNGAVSAMDLLPLINALNQNAGLVDPGFQRPVTSNPDLDLLTAYLNEHGAQRLPDREDPHYIELVQHDINRDGYLTALDLLLALELERSPTSQNVLSTPP